jgi:hypothetical protein
LAVISAVPGLDPVTYVRSRLHADASTWPEKNCYVDIWIEVLHALRLEPLAAMPFVLAMDFEGDQWTFFKPAHEDLFQLYGVEVQELNVWRPLLEHAREHLSAGKMISTEADAYWLPDVAGTDYRRNHIKTTIVMNSLDLDSRTLDYFHNSSYHRLSGEDFDRLFRIGADPDPTFLPLFAEFIRHDRVQRMETGDLAERTFALMHRYLRRRPGTNPVLRFGEYFHDWLPRLQERGLDYYHLWAFGTIRQLGASSELTAECLAWLDSAKVFSEPAAAEAFRSISSTCKTLILKGARAVASRKPANLWDSFNTLAQNWDQGMNALDSRMT